MTEAPDEHWEAIHAALRGLQLLVKDVANYDFEFLEVTFDDTQENREAIAMIANGVHTLRPMLIAYGAGREAA